MLTLNDLERYRRKEGAGDAKKQRVESSRKMRIFHHLGLTQH